MTELQASSVTKVAFVVDYYLPAVAGGGVPHAVRALLEDPRLDPMVVTTDADFGAARPHDDADRLSRDGRATVRYLTPAERRPHRIWRLIDESGVEVVVLTTPFSRRTVSVLVGRMLRRRTARPAVVLWSQGELLSHSLRQKRWKKRAFLATARAVGLFRGVEWFVVDASEAVAARRWFGVDAEHRPVAVPAPPPRVDRPPKERGTLTLLFAGRLVRRKGVQLVLRALAEVDGTVTFTIIGPEEDRSLAAECRRLASGLPQHVTVDFAGPATHADTMRSYETHQASVLLTEAESFGYAIFESISCGCVPVVSRMTPFRFDDGSGLHADLNVESVRAALQRLVDMDSTEYATRSEATRARAEQMWAADDHADHLVERLVELGASTAR